ncbi:hypothetical protein LR392_14955 [Arthrobacter sp. AK04]|uniref:hypothetical protein n=1 Tax=Arthrobacter sp. AK04 TaxID=2900048 RepID=UPI001E363A43|nr:hypothetical protein [Arthrobacter sp. AK04]MCD5343523.1 hypothetical protein [Arthrobacter sp. AK04]
MDHMKDLLYLCSKFDVQRCFCLRCGTVTAEALDFFCFRDSYRYQTSENRTA